MSIIQALYLHTIFLDVFSYLEVGRCDKHFENGLIIVKFVLSTLSRCLIIYHFGLYWLARLSCSRL